MKRYLYDWQAITACETKRDQEIEVLRQQIRAVESRAAEEIALHHADQAVAAALIRDQGQSDDDVAELLEISTKHARQLINAGRAASEEMPLSASPEKATMTPTVQPEQDGRHVAVNVIEETLAGEVGEPRHPVMESSVLAPAIGSPRDEVT
ncbi:hypothetical protein ACQP1G_17565 [Nocardia sp. CA-107356]|uniref:hypothetical protein n=1 Tax=Nocardia sp. CA-107356 TaxID=3239972 RepID=UPI003D8BDC48